jgi:glutamine cyclotransferase
MFIAAPEVKQTRFAHFTMSLFCFLTIVPSQSFARVPVAEVEVVKSYPHDPRAFTEGLLYRGGALYESTGVERRSTIREVDIATGRVLRATTIPPALFGEGIVDWKDQLLSITWRGGIGFRWSLRDFHYIGQFHYEGEGWGMTQDGHQIILSDGTSVLRFMDPNTFKVDRRLYVTADGKPVMRLNELEFVHGEILANIWLTSRIGRIDPRSGLVKGWIDLRSLVSQIGSPYPDAVPNGIAYDRAGSRLFVTGKDWPTLFQIRLRPQSSVLAKHMVPH